MEKGSCYMILHGKYTGKSIVFINTIGNIYRFLMLGNEFKIVALQKQIFNKYFESSTTVYDNFMIEPILDFIEVIPQEVFEVVEAQFNKEYKDIDKKDIITSLQ